MNIPPDHPRLFFAGPDLPHFKARLDGPYRAKAGDTPRTLIREHGFAYLMNGDAAAAHTAITAALRLCKSGLGSRPNDDFEAIFDIALCYDWCHAALGEAGERMRVILAEAMDAHHYTRAMDRGPGHNMTTENTLAAVSAGLALFGEHPNAAQWLADARRVVVDEAMGGWLDRFCPDGGDFEGVQYHGARYQGEAIFAWLWLKGTGENLFTPDHPHLLNGVNWWIYLLEPHLEGTHIVQGDTNHRGISARNVTSAACLSLGARDPFSQGGVMVAFCDGHAKWMPTSAVVTNGDLWCANGVNRSTNKCQ